MTNISSSKPSAGWTYCGIGVFQLLGKLSVVEQPSASRMAATSFDIVVQDLLSWLASRQTSFITEDYFDDMEDSADETNATASHLTFEKEHSYPAASGTLRKGSGNITAGAPDLAGFNGRCNKIADSCYAFWVGASLAVRIEINFATDLC